MSDEEEKRPEKTGRSAGIGKQRVMLEEYSSRAERELMQFLRACGPCEDSPRFAELVKLFRESGPVLFQ
jgi:hypothetical protein